MRIKQTEIAWAAGLFDGEGNTCRRSGKGRHLLRLETAQAGDPPELLNRFREAVGGGKVGGPYGPYGTSKKPWFRHHAGDKEGREILNRLWPYLSRPKREQAEKAGYAHTSG